MRTFRTGLVALLASILASSCGEGDEKHPDAAVDMAAPDSFVESDMALPDAAGDAPIAADATPDSTPDMMPDAGSGFPLKDNCPAPDIVVDRTTPDGVSGPVIASAPGSPLIVAYNLGTDGFATDGIEAQVWDGSAFGNPHPFTADGTALYRGAIAAGGGIGMFVGFDDVTLTGYQWRYNGSAWEDVGASTSSSGQEDDVKVGAAGDILHVWLAAGSYLGAAIGSKTQGTLTTLAEQMTLVSETAAAVDSAGDGFAIFVSGGSSVLSARAIQGGDWAGAAVPLSGTGTSLYYPYATILPDGSAYVVWTDVGGAGGAYGATVSHDGAGAAQWSAIDTHASSIGAYVLAVSDGDGDLTVVWGQGGQALTHRRYSGVWDTTEPLGAHAPYDQGMVVDTAGHVTVLLQTGGVLSHRRIAKGSTTWTAPVTLTPGADPPNSPAQIALDPATEDPIFVWPAGRDLLVERCQ